MPGIIPSPNELRPAQVLSGPFAATAALVNGIEYKVAVAVAGARIVTVRAEFLAAGTLSFKFLHPDGVTAYTAANPADVAVANGDEVATTVTCNGEAILQIVFTPSEDGVVSFVHVYQL